MHQGFPKPKGVTEQEAEQLGQLSEQIHGPIVGAFVIEEVTHGNHPAEVKEAWRGVRVPVRKYANGGMKYGSPYINVDCGEAYNALVASGAPDSVLQHWIGILPEDPTAVLSFRSEDGKYEHFYPEEAENKDSIPF